MITFNKIYNKATLIGKSTRKSIFLALQLAVCSSVAMMTSCSDWDDHYADSASAGNSATIWEMIQQRPELSDFAEVLSNTKVFRHHKKTSVSYSDYINGNRSLTVFAPVNGTFDKQALLNQLQTNEGDSMVEQFFVLNHIVDAPQSATEQKLRMLNNKYVDVNETSANGIAFKSTDLHSRNGVLHVIEKPLPYMKTIYETFTSDDRFTGLGNILKGFNEDHFNEEASISSGIVDGIKVYVDSVTYEDNKLMNYIGLLNSEDSTYWMAVPSQKAWEKAMDEAYAHFKYSNDIEKGDSLQRFWANEWFLENLVFSKTIQASPQDSVVSRWYNKTQPQYGVFKNPYDKATGLFGSATDSIKCSNGTIYYYDEWPIDAKQTYFRKLEYEMESTWNVIENEKCQLLTMTVSGDSISKGAFLDVVPNSKTVAWSLKYKLANTFAGKYDVCVVVLPKTVMGLASKTCRFQATINYFDENGVAQTFDCENKKTFTTDKAKVDTIVVAEDFVFPACNYDMTNDKISITLKTNITKQQQASSDNEMYLDCIFLRPKD